MKYEDDLEILQIETENLKQNLEECRFEMQENRHVVVVREGQKVYFPVCSIKKINVEIPHWVKVTLIGFKEMNMSEACIVALETIAKDFGVELKGKLPHRSFVASIFRSGYVSRLGDAVLAVEILQSGMENASLLFDGHCNPMLFLLGKKTQKYSNQRKMSSFKN